MIEPIILVHGGAGDIPQCRVPAKIDGVKQAVRAGYKILLTGGSALDAVEAAVRVMEDDEAFNAGINVFFINTIIVFYGCLFIFMSCMPYRKRISTH